MEYENYQNSKRKSSGPAPSSQRTLTHLRTGVTSGRQKTADDRIIKFIVNGMKPLSTVEEPDFRILIKGEDELLTNTIEIHMVYVPIRF